MSLLPFILEEYYPTSHHRFGSGYRPRESHSLVSPLEYSLLNSLANAGNYLRSQNLDAYVCHQCLTDFAPLGVAIFKSLHLPLSLVCLDDIEKQAHISKDGGFQVNLDVQHFNPNEIAVKTENNSIVVHAKHEEKKDDHGYISREFTRRYELPKGFKLEDVTSSLSSDGVLSIKCPPAPAIKDSNVRHIQIQQTGPAKLSVKSNEEKKDEKKK